MVVLSKYIQDFKKVKDDNDSEKGDNDDDDIIIKNESDSEDNEASDKDKAFFLGVAKHIEGLKDIFKI